MYTLEFGRPYLPAPPGKTSHDIQNALLSLLSFVTNGALGLVVLAAVTYTADHQLGLLNQLALPPLVAIPAGMLLYDLGSYALHNIQHHVPFLWRFHRVHHSDPHLNATSSLRFHPLEVVLTQMLFPSLWIPIVGMSMASFIVYGTVALVLLIPQHSNVRFPGWFERYGRLIFSTPGWHKIHHSNETRLTNSHYGDVFSVWDRLFGTWSRVQPDEITYGLDEFQQPERQRASFLLRAPFVDVKR
jgi:sterol desaturase/sphingolipid hydroxylase (fatty acid hydroxylase superfamily)